MLPSALAGAAIGAGIAWYEEEEEIGKSAAVGAASAVAGEVIGGMSSRKRAISILSSAAVYTGMKHCCLQEGDRPYTRLFLEGLGLGLGTTMVSGMYGRINDGTSILDYTRGQAP